MQKLQNSSARVLTFSGYDTTADGLLQDLGWENLETQRQIHQAIMVYKSINGLAPEYLRSNLLIVAVFRVILLGTLLANLLFLFLAPTI